MNFFEDALNQAFRFGQDLVNAAKQMWHDIVQYSRQSILPWIERNLPTFHEIAKQAFIVLDNVVAAVVNMATLAWKEIRKVLLQQLTTITQDKSTNQYVMKVTSIFVKYLEGKPQFIEVEQTPRTISWIDLPPSVREAFIRNNPDLLDSFEIDNMRMFELELEQQQ